MEQSSFLDFVCQNITRTSQDTYMMIGVCEYSKLLVAYNLGVIDTEQMADRCVAIIRSVRSREVGQMLYENYLQQTL